MKTSQSSADSDSLLRAIAAAGWTQDEIYSAQLIHVSARLDSAELRCFEKTGNEWLSVDVIGSLSGHIGKNGISSCKNEGDGRTPAGLFKFGHAFGVREKPETKMIYRKVTKDSFWVDDPASRFYNMWVEGRQYADWASAERLSDYPREYAYAVIIEYNIPERLSGKGSAIFLHCGDRPTSGCIAVPEQELLQILKWLDPAKSPLILVSGR
ncbi:MAG: L,D-transpeptidase family protein [Clostridiales bacterium]|jgi:L,D-peptidoglycan transpeptidase YkuD (ErfK/YbiS/YcfS/YnhG family)|nr:L,D-transpeptidase family protein [Clostridiales bacterium]